MELFVTPDFILAVAVWCLFIGFTIGFFFALIFITK